MAGSKLTRLCISSQGTCQRSYRSYQVPFIHAQALDKHFNTTSSYYFLIRPIVHITELGAPMDIESWPDSDWAGCVTTRRSTSGFLISIIGTVARHASRTQLIHAMSFAEAELYAIGACFSKRLHVKSFFEEAGISKTSQTFLRTESAAHVDGCSIRSIEEKLDIYNFDSCLRRHY